MSTPTTAIAPATQPTSAFRVLLITFVLLNFGKTVLLAGAGQPSPETDGIKYWELGAEFCRGDWLERGLEIAHWPPGYPLFLCGIQKTFGSYAIVATTFTQLLLDFAAALITAWICAGVARDRAGALVGLALSFFCVSRSCFAVYVMADNLFCLLMVLYFAALVHWLEGPSYRWTAILGTALGAAVLTKAAAQPLLVLTLALMAYKLRRSSCLRRLWRHAAVLLVVVSTLMAPWYVRNYKVFRKYFFVQFTGRAFWDTLHGYPKRMPVPLSDGPKNRALRAALDDANINMAYTWDVNGALRKKGYSDYDVDKLMQAAVFETISERPGQYLAGRPLLFAWFWVTPKAVVSLAWGSFCAARGLPAGWPEVPDGSGPDFPPGQRRWSVPMLSTVNKVFLKAVWHPHAVLYGLAALAAAAGCAWLVRDPARREAGLAAAGVLLVVSLTTALFGCPQYRYRMPLEPVMIAAVTPLLLSNRILHRALS